MYNLWRTVIENVTIKLSIYGGFPIAMFDFRRVLASKYVTYR